MSGRRQLFGRALLLCFGVLSCDAPPHHPPAPASLPDAAPHDSDDVTLTGDAQSDSVSRPLDVAPADSPAEPDTSVDEVHAPSADSSDVDIESQLPEAGGVLCHTQADCDDGMPCTDDACITVYGYCAHVPVPECEVCAPGVSIVVQCSVTRAAHPCADVKCGGEERCTATPNHCESPDLCLVGACDVTTSECIYTPKPDGVCAPCVADADCPESAKSAPCMALHCADGECEEEALSLCADGDECTINYCDALAQACRKVDLYEPPCASTMEACDGPEGCDDGNPCTFDACDGHCVHEVVPCDDGNPCTSGHCNSDPFQPDFGKCQYWITHCSDGDACTVDSCDALTGCTFVPKVCDDLNDCTFDSCSGGVCVTAHLFCCGGTWDACLVQKAGTCTYLIKKCDDGDPCTVNSCDAETGCNFPWRVCSDGDPCSADHCAPEIGACVFLPLGCDDADPCTSDSCDPVTGACSYTDVCG